MRSHRGECLLRCRPAPLPESLTAISPVVRDQQPCIRTARGLHRAADTGTSSAPAAPRWATRRHAADGRDPRGADEAGRCKENGPGPDPGMACEAYVPAPPASRTAQTENTFKERNSFTAALDPGASADTFRSETKARRSLPGPDAGHPLQGAAAMYEYRCRARSNSETRSFTVTRGYVAMPLDLRLG
jgi:hypothetical protein